jgi:hypothetical protein
MRCVIEGDAGWFRQKRAPHRSDARLHKMDNIIMLSSTVATLLTEGFVSRLHRLQRLCELQPARVPGRLPLIHALQAVLQRKMRAAAL